MFHSHTRRRIPIAPSTSPPRRSPEPVTTPAPMIFFIPLPAQLSRSLIYATLASAQTGAIHPYLDILTPQDHYKLLAGIPFCSKWVRTAAEEVEWEDLAKFGAAMNAIMSHRFLNPATKDMAEMEFVEAWVKTQLGDAEEGKVMTQEEAGVLAKMTDLMRYKSIQQVYKECLETLEKIVEDMGEWEMVPGGANKEDGWVMVEKESGRRTCKKASWTEMLV